MGGGSNPSRRTLCLPVGNSSGLQVFEEPGPQTRHQPDGTFSVLVAYRVLMDPRVLFNQFVLCRPQRRRRPCTPEPAESISLTQIEHDPQTGNISPPPRSLAPKPCHDACQPAARDSYGACSPPTTAEEPWAWCPDGTGDAIIFRWGEADYVGLSLFVCQTGNGWRLFKEVSCKRHGKAASCTSRTVFRRRSTRCAGPWWSNRRRDSPLYRHNIAQKNYAKDSSFG